MSAAKAIELLVAAVKEIEALPSGVSDNTVHGAYAQTNGALRWLSKYEEKYPAQSAADSPITVAESVPDLADQEESSDEDTKENNPDYN